jgi:hypothetical protein
MVSNPRYDGKPLLRLLDLYVLRAIGELPPDQEDGLKSMAPQVASSVRRRRTKAALGWGEMAAKAPDVHAAAPATGAAHTATAATRSETVDRAGEGAVRSGDRRPSSRTRKTTPSIRRSRRKARSRLRRSRPISTPKWRCSIRI